MRTARVAIVGGGLGGLYAAFLLEQRGVPWSGRLTGIASEWSSSFPGYLAGAVEAAQLGVAALLGAGSVISREQS